MKIMNEQSVVVSVLVASLIGMATLSFADDKPANYVALKGGLYSPSISHDLDTFNNGNQTSLDSKTGFSGEIAVGRYYSPMVALELGVGYLQSKGSPAAAPGELTLKVVPLVATGKVLLPIGIFEPYGLFGIGAYITDMHTSDNTGTLNGSTQVTYGLHAGAGVNINYQNNIFVGVEAKYLWADPSFGGQHIRLDGFVTTATIGLRI